MKRIFFTQQKPFHYASLRAGLGLITPDDLMRFSILTEVFDYAMSHCASTQLCPKLLTTRTRPLSGEYVVVEGSRYHARPVEPRIEFRVQSSFELNLKTGRVASIVTEEFLNRTGIIYEGEIGDKMWFDANEYLRMFINLKRYVRGLPELPYSFPEMDLGIVGSTFGGLRDELLRLNPKKTIDDIFHVNLLEPITKTGSKEIQTSLSEAVEA